MRRAAVLGAALLAAGCATPSAVEEAGLRRGSRVGIVNLMHPHLSHYHRGSTSIDSFERRYASDADLPGFVLERLRLELRERNAYVLVQVPPTPEMRATAGQVLDTLQSGPSGGVVSGVQQLAREHRLDHVLVLGDLCGAVLQTRRGQACGHGLYTEQAAGGGPQAFAYFNVAVLRLTPMGRLLRPALPLAPSQSAQEIREFRAGDMARLTPEEVHGVLAAVRQVAARRVADSAVMVE